MRTCRIHIVGASGAGVTSLGRALADVLALPHHDTDDYFWLPTNPPYQEPRPIADRLRLMFEMFSDRAGWVLSGSLDDWGDPMIPLLDLVFFLYTPTPIRLERLRRREERHFGAAAVAPGGWRYEETESFIEWASHYDDGTREARSLPRHQTWLARLSCPVLRLDGSRPLTDLVRECCAEIETKVRCQDAQ
jgi:adenylate kinase family enzyme